MIFIYLLNKNAPASQSKHKENVFYKINNSKRKKSIENDINKSHPDSKSTNVRTQATNEGEEKVTRVTLNSKK